MFATAESHPYLWRWAEPRADKLWIQDDLAPYYLDELEWLFRAIETAAPPGWELKRRAFQTDTSEQGLKGQYLEFVLAAKLIDAGLSIEFPDRPDIVVNGVLGIECWSMNTNLVDPPLPDGDLDIYRLQRHLATVEQKVILQATLEKAHQAQDYPTILAVGTAHAGITWIRPPLVWAGQLESMKDDIGDFAGVMVVNATYGAPYVHDATVVVRDHIPVAEYQQVCRALGLVPVNPGGSMDPPA